MLDLEGVSAGYTDEDIIHAVSLHVSSGEIVTIIGPNGCGKSTLMKSIFGLTRQRSGRILYRGQDITAKNPDYLVRLGLGYVPQERNIFPSLTVGENLEIGGFLIKGDNRERLDFVLGLFPDLADRMGQRAGTLSGGEQKMLAVGRAMVTKPDLLLLDEPSAALSPKIMGQLFAEIKAINDIGVTILMVEQNARRALAISDRGYILEMGRNRLDGPAKSLLDDPKVCQLFLGRR
ncbi:MAG: ABC transporter ATP-binding protein [Methanothrix sp.]|jgi:ABC-type branched-subunit amino acid transport system ATPase component|nr:ABC transporter ATP-binding protein [Methanothrix sp.]